MPSSSARSRCLSAKQNLPATISPPSPLSAQTFAKAVRAHWGIENRLHWVFDVVFYDDPARLRSGAGPENMATNLIRQDIPLT